MSSRKLRPAADILPSARSQACRLTYEQRAILIKHIDGASPIMSRNRPALKGLIQRGIITDLYGGVRQRDTKLTDDGREILAALLAEYAEGLIAAGFTPLDLVRYSHTTQPRETADSPA
jgi:hypothetical protein